jgi:hypothetical protein
VTHDVELYAGPHEDLLWSFRQAEEAEDLLKAYIDLGQVWVARREDGEVVGHLRRLPRDTESGRSRTRQ